MIRVMIPRQGHINNVNATQKAAQMYGGLDIIYTDRRSLKHQEGPLRRAFDLGWAAADEIRMTI